MIPVLSVVQPMPDRPKTPLPHDPLSLEAVYYPAPIPRGAAVLTLLGTVFDRVHFPHVYLPIDGYDRAELDKEIARLKALPGERTEGLIELLDFVKHTKVLDGFCVFTPREQRLVHEDQISQETLKELYYAIHPRRPGWEPMFPSNYSKALPGGEEFIAYPGPYNYFALAAKRANKTGIPLVSDYPGLPIPGAEEVPPYNDAKALSTVLAIEATKLVMPALPILRPEELMEFRSENIAALRGFRRAMLTYAAELNDKIKDLKPAEFEETTRFFVQTEIAPSLDVLRDAMNKPARPWYKRIIDGAGMLASVGPSFFTMPPEAAIAHALAKVAGQLATEIMAEGDHRSTIKRSGLFYLIRLERFKGRQL